MTDNDFDPFAPQEAGAKTKFGRLKLFANPVALESGASYTIKGIHDREGNIREWRGKKIVKGSRRFHLILHMFCKDKDGNEYEVMRDHLNNDKSYKDIVHPALTKVFGVDVTAWPREQYAYVQVEEVPTGETFDSTRPGQEGQKVNRTTFKVLGKFANEAACKAAETKYFEQFSNGADVPETESDVTPEWLVKLKPKLMKLRKDGKSDEEIADAYDATPQQIEAVLA